MLSFFLFDAGVNFLVPLWSSLFVTDGFLAFLLESPLTIFIGLSQVEISGKAEIFNKIIFNRKKLNLSLFKLTWLVSRQMLEQRRRQ